MTLKEIDPCAWVKEIRFSDQSKMWLLEHRPWPEHIKDDFNKIGAHNEKVRAICGPE